MREILFRGKDIVSLKWVYGVPVKASVNCGDEYIEMVEKIEYETDLEYSTFVNSKTIITKTIGQYTGLTDKNGTKIFEGDIVKVLGMVGKVVYEYGSFGIAFDDCVDYKKLDDFTRIRIGNNFSGVCCDNFISLYEVYWNLNNLDEYLHEVEVIGNVFDNPELVEKVVGDDN